MSKQTKKSPQQPAATPPPSGNKPTFWANHRLHLLIMLLSGMLLYANSVGNDYAMDDVMTITGNKFTKQGVSGWGGLLGHDTFYGFFDEEKNVVAGGRYRPLMPMMFALEAELFAPIRVDANGLPAKDKDGNTYFYLESQHKRDLDPQGKEMRKSGKAYLIPHISHAINVLLYGILCAAIYLFLLTLLNPKRDAENIHGTFIAFTAGLLFAFHPLHTEAVANIKGRDEIVTMLGSVLAAYWLLRGWHEQNRNKLFVGLACVAYFLALLSKETAVTFLGVVPLCFWFFTNATIGQAFKRSLPIFLVFLGFFALRQTVLGKLGSLSIETNQLMNNPFLVLNPNIQAAPLVDVAMVEDSAVKARLGLPPNAEPLPIYAESVRIANPSTDAYLDMPAGNRLAMIFYTWGYYLRLLVVPHPLVSNYYPLNPYPTGADFAWGVAKEPAVALGSPMVLLSLLLTLVFLALGIWGMVKRRAFAFGILYFYGTFSIVSNLIFPIGANMSERFLFMPSLGFCLLVGMLLYWLADRAGQGLAAFKPLLPLCLMGVVLALFAFKTITRNTDWYDDTRLFLNDVQLAPNDAKLLNSAGGSLLDLAAEDLAKDNERIATLPPAAQRDSAFAAKQRYYARTRQAVSYLNQSLKIHPGAPDTWLLMGNAQFQLSQECNDLLPRMTNDPAATQAVLREALYHYHAAAAAFQEGINYRPTMEDVKQIKANVMAQTARFYKERLGLGDQANTASKEILDIKTQGVEQQPNNAEAWLSRGNAYFEANDFDKALADFSKALEINPKYDLAYFNRGNTYVRKNDFKSALVEYSKAIEINPNNKDYYHNRSVAYGNLGDKPKALENELKAIQLGQKEDKVYMDWLKN